MEALKGRILCLDFDGVIHSYESGWQGAEVVGDGPVAGAIAALHEYAKVFTVAIYSSRSAQPGGIAAMKAAIDRWDADRSHNWRLTRGGDPPAPIVPRLAFPDHKPPAFLSIDDRGICFEGIFPRAEDLLRFQPWNKRGRG